MKFTTTEQSTLLVVIKDKLGLKSNTKAREVIKSGRVEVSGNTVKIPSTELKSGVDINVKTTADRKVSSKITFPHPIVFENDLILVVNKRIGVITKASNRKLRTLFSAVVAYAKQKGEEIPQIVNSVDKKESGLVVFAKDLRTYKDLEHNWKSFNKRHYIVIPGGMLEQDGNLEDTFHENDIGLLLPGPGKKTHEVQLNYRVMKSNGEFSVIRVDEVSQVKNQIRAMFSSMKNPIVGDKKYRSEYNFERGMASHLFSIDLDLDGEEIKLRTPIPKAFLKLAR